MGRGSILVPSLLHSESFLILSKIYICWIAEYCSKADQYATPRPAGDARNGSYFMFLSRVLLGVHMQTADSRRGERDLPLRGIPEKPFSRYHSLIGSSFYYKEFVIYDGTRCYPEFLVEYKRADIDD